MQADADDQDQGRQRPGAEHEAVLDDEAADGGGDGQDVAGSGRRPGSPAGGAAGGLSGGDSVRGPGGTGRRGRAACWQARSRSGDGRRWHGP